MYESVRTLRNSGVTKTFSDSLEQVMKRCLNEIEECIPILSGIESGSVWL
jgi:hypothetical protein